MQNMALVKVIHVFAAYYIYLGIPLFVKWLERSKTIYLFLT